MVAQVPYRAQVVRLRQDHATLAHDRLQQDGHRLLGNRRPQGFDIVEGHVAEPVRHRRVRRLVLRLAGRRDHGQGPSVEGPDRADHLKRAVAVELAPFAGQFDGRLIGLGTAVGKEAPTLKAQRVEPLGKIDLRPRVVEVAGVDQGGGLARDRPDHRGVRMAQHVDSDASDEIQ